MSLLVSFYTAALFFALVPGNIVSLPKGGNKWTVVAVHALIFALIYHFTNKLVWRVASSLEGFTEGNTTSTITPTTIPTTDINTPTPTKKNTNTPTPTPY